MADSGRNISVSNNNEPVLSSTLCSTDESNLTKVSESDQEPSKIIFLNKAINKTVSKCISSVRLSSFAKSYPAAYKKNPKLFKTIHQEYKEGLTKAINTELDVMMQEGNLDELIAELDAVNNSSRDTGHVAWRPSGEPDRDMAAHYMPIKLTQKRKLQTLLDTIHTENKKLESHVRQRRKHLISTQQRVADKRDKIKQCIDIIPTREINAFLMTPLDAKLRDIEEQV